MTRQANWKLAGLSRHTRPMFGHTGAGDRLPMLLCRRLDCGRPLARRLLSLPGGLPRRQQEQGGCRTSTVLGLSFFFVFLLLFFLQSSKCPVPLPLPRGLSWTRCSRLLHVSLKPPCTQLFRSAETWPQGFAEPRRPKCVSPDVVGGWEYREGSTDITGLRAVETTAMPQSPRQTRRKVEDCKRAKTFGTEQAAGATP
ncbi:uncharacterized protein B0T15DRAFT_180841 [Chaetomium strumarium]|uniref:Transmembrane protein n=1 Tax=Chaetomium strumarium TaxID=1170767 RepID=A0AAJ0GWQ3_9PEZI|nr:hypothetical protein B0T15DRAFT_180841 [Chaetomium strumarium]